eukprot:scaffold24853_cov129-Isochrysis_galbana.AAC.3
MRVRLRSWCVCGGGGRCYARGWAAASTPTVVHPRVKKRQHSRLEKHILASLRFMTATTLLAISRGEPPPSLNIHRARLSPLATLDEEAELLFSDTFHDHLT